jgi:hypothetical protein
VRARVRGGWIVDPCRVRQAGDRRSVGRAGRGTEDQRAARQAAQQSPFDAQAPTARTVWADQATGPVTASYEPRLEPLGRCRPHEILEEHHFAAVHTGWSSSSCTTDSGPRRLAPASNPGGGKMLSLAGSAAHERHNRRWAIERGAGLRQRDARLAGEHIAQWLARGQFEADQPSNRSKQRMTCWRRIREVGQRFGRDAVGGTPLGRRSGVTRALRRTARSR